MNKKERDRQGQEQDAQVQAVLSELKVTTPIRLKHKRPPTWWELFIHRCYQFAFSCQKLWNRVVKNEAQGIIVVILIISLIGLVNIFSATYAAASSSGNIFSRQAIVQMISLVLGVIVAYGMYKFKYSHLKSRKWQAWIAGIIFVLLIAVLGGGTVVNGARRWFQIAGVSIQPSEFAKLASIVWTAMWVNKWRETHDKMEFGHFAPWKCLRRWSIRQKLPVLSPDLCIFLVPIAYAVATIIEPDMGTAVLIFMVSLVVFCMGGLDKSQLKGIGIAILVMAVAVGIAIWLSPYRAERVQSWYDPWSHARDLGYQTVQGLIAIGSGGLFGEGIGHGTAKFFYLPEAHTDFAFAVWAQETGFIGSIFLVGLFLLFTFLGLQIAKNARDYFGALLAVGCTFLISFQAFFNMLMVNGMLPVTGVPLPFISYGGSSLLVNFAAIGLLLNIARRSALTKSGVGTKARSKQNQQSLREETQSRFKPQKLSEPQVEEK